MSAPLPILIGVDTGGTFTDLLMVRGRTIHTFKTPSTPDDFSRGVLTGVRELRDRLPDPTTARFTLVHSSTVATNALLEGKGAPTALITTRGFRDVLELGRQNRSELYNFDVGRPAPLVPRQRRFELSERVDARGVVLRPADADEIESLLDRIERAGVESVAVCLLFSFLQPRHERSVAAAARRRGLRVSTSSEILPEFREYERTSTTVLNAFVAPVMATYLGRLRTESRKLGADSLRIVQSNGGSLSARAASAQPVQTLLSGPAAGLHGAMDMLRQSGTETPRFIAFDMGGTSTDVSLVDGTPTLTTEGAIAGYPAAVPMLDIHTVGAGGGSIARVDSGGALHVGPESAGASPGPACYGVGRLPTVTDANLVLGRISPEHFLNGRMPIDPERSQNALARLGAEIGCTAIEAAEGILRIVNANMERAIRLISIERGHDPRSFTLVSFGGAGSLHACALAENLNIPTVFVPAHPGVLSAWGAVASDLVKDFSQTLMCAGTAESETTIHRALDQLQKRAQAVMKREQANLSTLRFEPALDLRYLGQSYELSIPYPGTIDAAAHAFHAAHEKRYGHAEPDAPLQAVTVRLRCTAPLPTPRLARTRKTSRKILSARDGLIDRSSLLPGTRLLGPAILVEPFSTTYLPPGWTARTDAHGHLWITPS